MALINSVSQTSTNPRRYPLRENYNTEYYFRRYPLRTFYNEDGDPLTTIDQLYVDMENDGGLPVIQLTDPNYTGPELHVPTHNFLGPGTNVAKRVSSLNLPINRADAVALVHDIEYYGLPEHTADNNAIHNATGITKIAMLAAFKLKNAFGGMKPKRDLDLYHRLKQIVQTYKPYKDILDKYEIHFYEDYVPNFADNYKDDELFNFDVVSINTSKSF